MGRVTSPILLDTHTLIWALTEPDRLSRRARQTIESPRAHVVVSAASAWEIATKVRRGPMPQAEVVLAAYSRHLRRLRAQEAPITTSMPCSRADSSGITMIPSTGCSPPRPFWRAGRS